MKSLACFLVAVLCSTFAAAQTCSDLHAVRAPIVEAFRTINTAEVSYKFKNGRFVDLATLIASPEMKRAVEQMNSSGNQASFLRSDDPIPGYVVRLILAADGKSYSLTATKKDGPCSHYGGTTDDRGVIYFIEPMR